MSVGVDAGGDATGVGGGGGAAGAVGGPAEGGGPTGGGQVAGDGRTAGVGRPARAGESGAGVRSAAGGGSEAAGEPVGARWERRTQRPLLALAVAFAVAYAVPIVAGSAGPVVTRVCTAVEWSVWLAFAVDYAVRLGLAEDRRRFVRTHWMDLAAVLLPMVQPLRLLRLVSTLLLVGRRARMASQVRLTTYVAGSVVGLLMFGSLAVLSVERDAPDGNIRTLGDAVWWSFTTMTTVGYGDHAPTTGLGRVLAVGLMLSGIALLGVVTANIAAWFISRFEKDDAEERRQTAAIEALTEEVRALRAQVAALEEREDRECGRQRA